MSPPAKAPNPGGIPGKKVPERRSACSGLGGSRSRHRLASVAAAIKEHRRLLNERDGDMAAGC